MEGGDHRKRRSARPRRHDRSGLRCAIGDLRHRWRARENICIRYGPHPSGWPQLATHLLSYAEARPAVLNNDVHRIGHRLGQTLHAFPACRYRVDIQKPTVIDELRGGPLQHAEPPGRQGV